MSKRPFFSIIIPTYNQSQFLGAALESIIAQSDPDWEAIVINDGSTDATPEVMETYALKDSRLRMFHKSNGGVASALNEGRKQAQGQWICWLSSDDMFDPRKLEIHRQWIERHPDCQFFFTYFRLLRESTGEITDHDLWGPLPERDFQIVVLFYRNYISGISICINREAWDQVGLMDESLRYAQDFDMWLRLLAVYPARFIPEWTCINRNHTLQGSEVFPQACYFDTAKASIHFLNSHPFEDLFPLLDLNDPQTALRVLQKALDIAAEPSALLYSLGPHPALLFRILEWVWSTKIKRNIWLQRKLEWATRRSISRILEQQNTPAFNRFWKAAAVVTRLSRPRFEYQTISPAIIGEMHYYVNQSAGKGFLEPIEEYLQRYGRLQVDPWPERSSEEDLVLLLPLGISLVASPDNPAAQQVLRLARSLSRRGYRVVLAGHSKQSIGLLKGILFLGAEKHNTVKKMVHDLGFIDILVVSNHDEKIRTKAARKVVYDLTKMDTEKLISGRKLNSLIEEAPIQKDYYQIMQNALRKPIKWLGRKSFRLRQRGFHLLRSIKSVLIARDRS